MDTLEQRIGRLVEEVGPGKRRSVGSETQGKIRISVVRGGGGPGTVNEK